MNKLQLHSVPVCTNQIKTRHFRTSSHEPRYLAVKPIFRRNKSGLTSLFFRVKATPPPSVPRPPPSCVSGGWSAEWWFICLMSYLQIWPGNSGVKWPINLRPDFWRPPHRSHLAAVVSAQLLLRRRRPGFQEKSPIPPSLPPSLPPLSPSLSPSIHPSCSSSGAEGSEPVKRCWVQRLFISWDISLLSYLCKNPLRSLVSLARWKNTGRFLLSDIKAEAPRGGDWSAGRAPCQVHAQLCLYFDSCSGQSYGLHNAAAIPPWKSGRHEYGSAWVKNNKPSEQEPLGLGLGLANP